jgi:hypothetical protein
MLFPEFQMHITIYWGLPHCCADASQADEAELYLSSEEHWLLPCVYLRTENDM